MGNLGNLGWYRLMTTAAKKVGGPKVLLVLVAGGGYAVLRVAESGIKKIGKTVKTKLKTSGSYLQDKIYEVTAGGKDSNGLTFRRGEKYKVLESDGDAILIEKVADDNNPYFVSKSFLATISNFGMEEILV